MSQPNCVGFNDNGWMKNSLNPYNSWVHWTDDPKLGFRVNLSRTAIPDVSGVSEFD